MTKLLSIMPSMSRVTCLVSVPEILVNKLGRIQKLDELRSIKEYEYDQRSR
jgi:hypothetical protein